MIAEIGITQQSYEYTRETKSAIQRLGLYFPITETVEMYGQKWVIPELPSTHIASKQLSFQKVLSQLEFYTQLSEGWDGYKGQPATRASVDDAAAFLGRLPMHLPTPKPMISGDGEVSLYWEVGTRYAEAAFPGDGTFHFIFDSEEENVCIDNISSTDEYLSEEILSNLNKIQG